MPALPIAAFLAGALLSLLLPTVLLIALVVWHFGVIARVPEPPDQTEKPAAGGVDQTSSSPPAE
jgi:hypothetical protein